jgi:mono/diheme cytochrome c family protein
MEKPKQFTAGVLGCAGALALCVLIGPSALAQIKGMPGLDATQPLGREAPSGDAPAEGELRPATYTDAQAARGKLAYTRDCLDCHGAELNDGEFGGAPLVGSYFDEHWGGLTVDALFGYLSSAMPPDRPGRLTPQTYADITAFILERNGIPSGSQELPADLEAMATMEIVP